VVLQAVVVAVSVVFVWELAVAELVADPDAFVAFPAVLTVVYVVSESGGRVAEVAE